MSVHANLAPWRKLLKRALEMRTLKARVGVLASKGGDAKPEGSDLTLVEIAAVHEFGNEHVPERSYLRSTFYVHAAAELRDMVAKISKAIIVGGMDVRRGIGLLGAWGAGAVQKSIRSKLIYQNLSPATLARKRVNGNEGDTALINQGHLVGAITWEYTEGGES